MAGCRSQPGRRTEYREPANPTGGGYPLVAADGGIFAYSAPFCGSTGSRKLNAPIVGMGAY